VPSLYDTVYWCDKWKTTVAYCYLCYYYCFTCAVVTCLLCGV